LEGRSQVISEIVAADEFVEVDDGSAVAEAE
jgi:hypothetical protein